MGIGLQWVFKIVYPLIFSFVPLVLYVVFKKQTSNRIAFCAAALIIVSFSFYTDMLALPRQQIGELFIALLILLIVSRELAPLKKNVLLYTFGSALIVSHYSLTYIFIYLLLVSLLLLSLRPSRRYLEIINGWGAAHLKINLSQQEHQDPSPILEKGRPAISLKFVAFLIVLALAWYSLSNGAPFITLLNTGQQIWNSIFSEFFSSSAIQPLATITGTQGPMTTVTKYLYYVITFFAIFGLVSVLHKRRRRPLQTTYIALSITAAVLLIGCMTVPNFAASLNTARFYQFAELLLAPFVVVGMCALLNILRGALSLKGAHLSENTALRFVVVFLAVFLLFNSGFVYTLAGETAISPAVLATNPDLTYPRWTDAEVAGAAWLHDHHGQALIYTHGYYTNLIGMTDEPSGKIISSNVTETLNSYIFTGALPTDKQPSNVNQTTRVINAVKNRNQIFSNGDIRIYR